MTVDKETTCTGNENPYMVAEKEATYTGNEMPYMTDKEATYTGKNMPYMADKDNAPSVERQLFNEEERRSHSVISFGNCPSGTWSFIVGPKAQCANTQ